jgi:hypothetical protein
MLPSHAPQVRHVIGEPHGPPRLLPLGRQPDHHTPTPMQIDLDHLAVLDRCTHQGLLTSEYGRTSQM